MTFARKLLLLFFFVFLFSSYLGFSYAQEAENVEPLVGGGSVEATLGVARMIEVGKLDAQDGNLLSASRDGAILSEVSYDPHVIGVVSRDAAIILNSGNVESGVPVISTGRVYVLVSSKEGAIRKNDLLTTSSEIPGVAVKAVKDGYVIGMALEGYDDPDTEKVGKIAADLDLHYFNSKPVFPGSLTDIFKLVVLPTRDGPSALFKYIIAAIVVISSFIFGFLTFGRTAAKGVEALGRNPAASRVIHLGIIFNVVTVIAIVLAGITIAFLILRL